MDYKILYGESGIFDTAVDLLAEQVNKALDEDWQLQGGITISTPTNAGSYRVAQAIYKPTSGTRRC